MSSTHRPLPSKTTAFGVGMGVAYILLTVLNLLSGMTLADSFLSVRPGWFFPLVAVIAIAFWFVERKKISTHDGEKK